MFPCEKYTFWMNPLWKVDEYIGTFRSNWVVHIIWYFFLSFAPSSLFLSSIFLHFIFFVGVVFFCSFCTSMWPQQSAHYCKIGEISFNIFFSSGKLVTKNVRCKPKTRWCVIVYLLAFVSFRFTVNHHPFLDIFEIWLFEQTLTSRHTHIHIYMQHILWIFTAASS